MAVEIIAPSGRAEAQGESWEAVAESASQRAEAEGASWEVELSTGVVIGGIPYEGSYEADARFAEQVFATRTKTMADDFTVHAINYTEAPNDSGVTLTIGG